MAKSTSKAAASGTASGTATAEPKAKPTPDAVLIPRDHWRNLFRGVTNPRYKMHRLRREFAPILGDPEHKEKFTIIKQPGGSVFAFLGPPEKDGQPVTLLFPTGHPMEKAPRYQWDDRGDGVKLGYLVDDPFAGEIF